MLRKKYLLIFLLILILLILLFVFFRMNYKNKIYLNDYLSIDYVGAEEFYISIDVDDEELIEENSEYFSDLELGGSSEKYDIIPKFVINQSNKLYYSDIDNKEYQISFSYDEKLYRENDINIKYDNTIDIDTEEILKEVTDHISGLGKAIEDKEKLIAEAEEKNRKTIDGKIKVYDLPLTTTDDVEKEVKDIEMQIDDMEEIKSSIESL